MPTPSRWLRHLLRPLWVLLAIIFIVEEWLWDRLSALGVRLAALIDLPGLKAQLAAIIARLSPAATLLVFLAPVVVLLPVKFLGLWMLARGSWFGALAVFVSGKVLGMGAAAFLFQATRPKLLQMAWFRWIYERVQRALLWAHQQMAPVKQRLRTLVAPLRLLARRPSGRLLRRILRIRRHVREH